MNDVKYPELPAPDSYLFQHDETGLTQYVDAQQVEWGFEANNPRLSKVSGAYSESQMRSYADATCALRGAQKESGWRPIETAPKDGKHILLAYAPDETHEDGFVSQGYWMESDEDGPDNMGHDAGFVDVHFDFFRCARSFGAEKYRHAGTQPTHWQPLSSAPTPEGEAK